MKNTITPTSKMITLVKREFWEHRILFLMVPVCVAGFLFVSLFINVIRASILDYNPVEFVVGQFQSTEQTVAEAIEGFASLPVRAIEGFWESFYVSLSLFLFLTFWGVMIFYFLDTLYQQRKNRSILFWNSMPVSNTETILSKLIAGLVVGQGVYLLCMLVLHVLAMITLTIYGSQFDVNVWDTFVAPAQVFSRFFSHVIFALINIVWCLPVYAWLLLFSAWSKSAPLAWAMGPLLLVIVPEIVVYENTSIIRTLFEHVLPFWRFDDIEGGVVETLGRAFSLELLISAILGTALVYAAIRLNRSEDH